MVGTLTTLVYYILVYVVSTNDGTVQVSFCPFSDWILTVEFASYIRYVSASEGVLVVVLFCHNLCFTSSRKLIRSFKIVGILLDKLVVLLYFLFDQTVVA